MRFFDQARGKTGFGTKWGFVGILTQQEVLNKLSALDHFKTPSPHLIYSSYLNGWTDQKCGLFVSLSDHGFHRGDGLFEAVRVIAGRPYLLKEHWRRMENAAREIELKLPLNFEDLKSIVDRGVSLFLGQTDLMMRLFVTRGHGGFSASTQESMGSEFFIVLVPFTAIPAEKYEIGVLLKSSLVPTKPDYFARIKSLNYLPNVLMKSEALRYQVDFTVNFNEESGCWGESSTENLIAITEDGVLCHPPLSRILKGCTMNRLFELVESKALMPIERERHMSVDDLYKTQALMMVGTTLDVVGVASLNGVRFSPSLWWKKLRELIVADQTTI